MSAVVAETVMTEQQAREVTERIRFTARNFVEVRQKLMDAVAEAREGQAHVALGYASWTAYLSDVMGEEPLRLARDERREVVQMLTDEGMSTRAIAPVLDVDQKTVVNDRRAGEENSSPVADETPALSAPSPVSAVTDIVDEEESTPAPQHSRPEPAPQQQPPSKPRRRPITDVIDRHSTSIDQSMTALLDSLDERVAATESAQDAMRAAINRWRIRLAEMETASGLTKNETLAA